MRSLLSPEKWEPIAKDAKTLKRINVVDIICRDLAYITIKRQLWTISLTKAGNTAVRNLIIYAQI